MNNEPPCVTAQMLIRKPVAEVFEAFINPEITKHFWFTKGSARLEEGTTVTWKWEMYNASAEVLVKEIIPGEKISIDWGDPVTHVDFMFRAVEAHTYIEIRNYGFTQTGDALAKTINDQTGGFTTVLDGLKAYMEHGINLNLIADKFIKK
jgi:uncharacterized protein YndB with AHSA1/START domain